MQGFMLLAGLEAVLIVGLTMKLRELRRLQKELHQTVFDLALACSLASKGRYEEAHAAARRWHDRMRAFKRGERYRPPSTPPQPGMRMRLH